MSQEFYVQCRLQRHRVDGFPAYKVSWIPEKFAETGRMLKIKVDGSWEKGWKVVDVWGGRLSREEINNRSRYYLTQRRSSDI